MKSRLLYVRNICKEDDQKDEDIVKMVKLHARYNGVRVRSARVIHNRFDDDIVGFKITAPDDEVRIVVNSSFWPDPVECREWNNRESKNKYNGNNNGHDSYSYTGRQRNEGAYSRRSRLTGSCDDDNTACRRENSKANVDYWDYTNEEDSYANRQY